MYSIKKKKKTLFRYDENVSTFSQETDHEYGLKISILLLQITVDINPNAVISFPPTHFEFEGVQWSETF